MGEGVESMLVLDLEEVELEESKRSKGGVVLEEKEELRPV